jgi:hypothetical protein
MENQCRGDPWALLLRRRTDYLTDRYSERNERQARLISTVVAKI